jgi:hypothetical protein
LPLAALAAVAVSACAPRLRPLEGAPAPASFPRATLPTGHRRVVFDWQLQDADIAARGEGAARSAWPDSVRMDFFVAGGAGSGAAILVGPDLRLPSRGDALTRRVVPPAPLLWATVGRLAIPALPDTIARVDGDTLRADIGTPVAWRVIFVRDTLARLERIEGGRVIEWVERASPYGRSRVRYRNEPNRRQLDLTVTRFDTTGGFDPGIWHLP